MTPNELPAPLVEAIRFHGHLCPGLTLGYRAAHVAMRHLREGPAADEELVCVVENDSCSLDAIQVMTGCTVGKGNLVLANHGKHVYTFLDRVTGATIRLALRAAIDISRLDERAEELRPRVLGGTATPRERAEFAERQGIASHRLLNMREEDLFTIDGPTVAPPGKARLFNSGVCSLCGEPVSEGMARVQDGGIVCIPCHRGYTRGW